MILKIVQNFNINYYMYDVDKQEKVKPCMQIYNSLMSKEGVSRINKIYTHVCVYTLMILESDT